MPCDSERSRVTREWLQKASDDREAAELLLRESSLYELAAFHCQQAVEKALKGYLTWHERPFRKTHDLLELIDQCSEIDSLFSTFRSFARDISPYFIVVRYPDVEGEIAVEDVKAALERTAALLEFVQARLPLE